LAFRLIFRVSVRSPFGGWVTAFADFCFILRRFCIPLFGVLAPGFWFLCGGSLRCPPPVAGLLRVPIASCYHSHHLVFPVLSAALPIFSASDLPPSVHCRAFPCDPTATSSNAPCTGRFRLLRNWLFPVLLVFSVCILLLFSCIAVFCL
jgi:hypothetical protein